MRLPLIDPRLMNSAQKALYDDVRSGIPDRFTKFKSTDPDTAALLGPWNVWLHEPEMGAGMWALSKAVAGASQLLAEAREVAILVIGSHYSAAYELYAHVAIAKDIGMSRERLSTLCAGGRPADLNRAESAAFECATALVRGRVLPEACYRNAIETLGQHGANQLFWLISLYCAVAVLLNAYNMPAPEHE